MSTGTRKGIPKTPPTLSRERALPSGRVVGSMVKKRQRVRKTPLKTFKFFMRDGSMLPNGMAEATVTAKKKSRARGELARYFQQWALQALERYSEAMEAYLNDRSRPEPLGVPRPDVAAMVRQFPDHLPEGLMCVDATPRPEPKITHVPRARHGIGSLLMRGKRGA